MARDPGRAVWWLAVALIGCAHAQVRNEVVARSGRHVEFRAPIQSATFCAGCGKGAPVAIEFGAPARVSLVIPSCYPHAESKVGDHDRIQIELVEGHVAATEGELDIADCTARHVVATLWAKFPDGTRIDAAIDTALQDPGK